MANQPNNPQQGQPQPGQTQQPQQPHPLAQAAMQDPRVAAALQQHGLDPARMDWSAFILKVLELVALFKGGLGG
jgi:hypothetical protein